MEGSIDEVWEDGGREDGDIESESTMICFSNILCWQDFFFPLIFTSKYFIFLTSFLYGSTHGSRSWAGLLVFHTNTRVNTWLIFGRIFVKHSEKEELHMVDGTYTSGGDEHYSVNLRNLSKNFFLIRSEFCIWLGKIIMMLWVNSAMYVWFLPWHWYKYQDRRFQTIGRIVTLKPRLSYFSEGK